MQIIDKAGSRGYVMHRENRLLMLGANDDATASVLLICARPRGQERVWVGV